ncbi:unnamed protein product [Trichogramma brassicae]|uniref:Reverse transcriptase zinc-binding domain-containing protein n=1 Tax=Trichogramma brassicae TaxID=86971 RepID=A0A6H5HXJ5_9HYME|nr:unnamed protein product [Trichogramma brassicae]
MYLQVRLHPEDWKLQTILWRDDPRKEIEHYVLTTVTFGSGPSAFLANRTLRQLADDEEDEFPLAAPIVRNEMYMDDVLSGAFDVESATRKRNQLSALLSAGGFTLAKWMTNNWPSVARAATESPPAASPPVYSTDLAESFRRDCFTTSITKCEADGLHKGIIYFDLFHRHEKSTPWFTGKNLPRSMIVTINRIRSNHHSLAESLHRKNIIDNPGCACGSEEESLNHVLWNCGKYERQRRALWMELARLGLSAPLNAEKLRNMRVTPSAAPRKVRRPTYIHLYRSRDQKVRQIIIKNSTYKESFSGPGHGFAPKFFCDLLVPNTEAPCA